MHEDHFEEIRTSYLPHVKKTYMHFERIYYCPEKFILPYNAIQPV